jgi:hypothetical protein
MAKDIQALQALQDLEVRLKSQLSSVAATLAQAKEQSKKDKREKTSVHFSPSTDLRHGPAHAGHCKTSPIGGCDERVRNPMRSSSHPPAQPAKAARAPDPKHSPVRPAKAASGHNPKHSAAQPAKAASGHNPARSSPHSPGELHCRFFHRVGGCKDGDECPYKHTSWCRYFKTTAGCKYGEGCRYSHQF